MRYDKPFARLREVFPAEFVEKRKHTVSVDGALELRLNKQRLVLSELEDSLLLEIETPTNLRSGHGWGLVTQLRLDAEHVAALHSYLTERVSEKVQ